MSRVPRTTHRGPQNASPYSRGRSQNPAVTTIQVVKETTEQTNTNSGAHLGSLGVVPLVAPHPCRPYDPYYDVYGLHWRHRYGVYPLPYIYAPPVVIASGVTSGSSDKKTTTTTTTTTCHRDGTVEETVVVGDKACASGIAQPPLESFPSSQPISHSRDRGCQLSRALPPPRESLALPAPHADRFSRTSDYLTDSKKKFSASTNQPVTTNLFHDQEMRYGRGSSRKPSEDSNPTNTTQLRLDQETPYARSSSLSKERSRFQNKFPFASNKNRDGLSRITEIDGTSSGGPSKGWKYKSVR